jgi:hypothetical protein
LEKKCAVKARFADHYFHSESAIAYVPDAQPQRAVFLCVQEQYTEPFQRASNAFQLEVLAIRDRALTTAQQAVSETEKLQVQQDILRELNECVDRHVPIMMDLVQLEAGDYELTILIDYKNPRAKFSRKQHTAQSMISFVVDQNVRDVWRSTLRGTLLASGYNLIYNRNDPVTFPEYNPLRISTGDDLQ